MPARTTRRLAALAACALAAASPAAAAPARSVQGPAADWRTVETAHFRVHYPAAAEQWARYAAARLEAVRERVAGEVGFTVETTVDVVVSDPVAQPNGFAYPFLGWPRLVLWTSPPGPDSAIGHYRDWPELLLVHEAAHLAHLLRPPRDPLRRALGRLLPVGPIAFAPRWVSEGYATLVEGRLTGSGRPNGDLRAAVLRRRALAGKLPSYEELSGDASTWLGRSMAYLAGSAYLEWLEGRAGEGSLRDLWARMTARTRRGFAESFRGVFADSPEDLYGRFTAELTWRAVEAERRLDEESGGPGFREGEIWLDLDWQSGAPAASPDGRRLALVVRGRDEPDELVVWSTAVDEAAAERARRRREEAARRDPEDVPAVDAGPPPRGRLAALPTIDGAAPAQPRWMPDGGSLLVVRWLPDAEGFLHPDLHRWWPDDGRLDRLTRAADLRQPDPAPDGTWAAAVETRHGRSRLVRVELAGAGAGEVEGLTAPAVDVVYDGPRVSPDGAALAFARHAAGRWELVVRGLEDGREEALPVPPGATASSPAWGRGESAGTLFAVVGSGGFIDVYAFVRDPAADGGWRAERRTRTRGAALAPELSAGGDSLFFLSLEPDGLDLRRLELASGAADLAGPAEPASPGRTAGLPELADLAPAVRPAASAAPPPPAPAELPAGRAFGLGRHELAVLGGGSEAPSSRAAEVGVRSGDLLGRLDLVATASFGDRALVEGGAVAAAWRGPSPLAPLTFAAHVFAGRERPSRQPVAAPGLGGRLDLERRGLDLSAAWERRAGPGAARLAGGGYAARVEPLAGPAAAASVDERSLFAEGSWRPSWSRGPWRAGLGLAARADAGETDGESWSRRRGALSLSAGRDDTGLALSWAAGDSARVPVPWQLFQVGGVGSSVLPSSTLAARVPVPALPAGTLLGDRFEAQRAELTLGALPLPLFYARYRAGGDGAPLSPWLALAGAEWRGRLGPLPLLRLPAIDYTLGAAEVLDPPFEGEREWWLAVTWRP